MSRETHQFRLIATDLDGTLLAPDGSISRRASTAIRRVREAGLLVVLVSARPPRVIRQIARAADIGGLAICCNGAMLYDLERDSILQSTFIQPAQVEWLIKTLRAALPGLYFAVEDGLSVTCEAGYLASYTDGKERRLRVAETAVCYSSPIIKLMARHAGYELEELCARVLPLVGVTYSVTYSGGTFLEIATARVNKATALAQFCAQRAISAREVIAFGDMPNDLPMLQWAGRAIAVANAHPLVLAAAHAITRSNAEDGVALVLEQLLTDLPVRAED